jgi:UDP-glucose 4-epimerase
VTTSTWVVGSTGLLGSAVSRRLSADPQSTMISQAVRWSDSQTSLVDLIAGTRRWLELPGATAFRLVWAAGAGVTATRKNLLEDEVETFKRFASHLEKEIAERKLAAPLSFFLASSAGGIYSGGNAPPFTESSEPSPVSPYGETKLAMEKILIDFARKSTARAAIGRIANLYGPGQRIEKQQGFVSQLCRSMLARRPISVYVSLDTMRDYIFTDDAAVIIQACLERLERDGVAGKVVVKNIASHAPTTLGHVLHEAKLVFKRSPDVILASSPMAAGQTRDLRIDSTVWTELNDLPRRSLMVGLAETRASMELQLHLKGEGSR